MNFFSLLTAWEATEPQSNDSGWDFILMTRRICCLAYVRLGNLGDWDGWTGQVLGWITERT